MLLGSSIVSAFLVAVLCVFIVREGREEASQERKEKRKEPKIPSTCPPRKAQGQIPQLCKWGRACGNQCCFLKTRLSRNWPQF